MKVQVFTEARPLEEEVIFLQLRASPTGGMLVATNRAGEPIQQGFILDIYNNGEISMRTCHSPKFKLV